MDYTMIIKNFSPFSGQHCETTATGSLLKHIGVELSEPMLFGLGEGLGFIYWDMKAMEFPFIGGRIKPGLITKNIAKNLNLNLKIQETSSLKNAWHNVKNCVDSGIPVGLKLDCYHLDYFTNKIHFPAHYVGMYGYDDTFAYLADTIQQGGRVKTTLKNLALARNEKGPMSSRNLSYTITKSKELPNLRSIIPIAIKRNTQDFLNPPIKNIGYKGIEKTGIEIRRWFKRSRNIKEDFQRTALLMERGGTGGAIFRNMYRDFLKECLAIYPNKDLEGAYNLFCEISPLWTQVANLIAKAGKTRDIDYLNHASEILLNLAVKEKEAMKVLSEINV